MDTVIECVLPYLSTEDLFQIRKINTYWRERIDVLAPPVYKLVINYATEKKMSGSVFDLRIPAPSICGKDWNILFTLNNHEAPSFEELKFFLVSIMSKENYPIFQLFKSSLNDIQWHTSADSNNDFEPVIDTPFSINKINLKFRKKQKFIRWLLHKRLSDV